VLRCRWRLAACVALCAWVAWRGSGRRDPAESVGERAARRCVRVGDETVAPQWERRKLVDASDTAVLAVAPLRHRVMSVATSSLTFGVTLWLSCAVCVSAAVAICSFHAIGKEFLSGPRPVAHSLAMWGGKGKHHKSAGRKGGYGNWGGSKGKWSGKDWSGSAEHDWAQGYGWWAEDNGKGKGDSEQGPLEYVKRLEGRYAFAKQSLRPYYGEGHVPVYSPTKLAVDLWSKGTLRQVLTSQNSELARRPAVGLSTISHSIVGLQGALQAEATGSKETAAGPAIKALGEMFSKPEAVSFFQACAQMQPAKAATLTADALDSALGDWLGFFRDNKSELHQHLPRVLQFASALYLGCSQLAEATTMANALANWAQKIPATKSNQAALDAWRHDPKDLRAAKAFLARCVQMRAQEEASWGAGKGGDGGDSEGEAPEVRRTKRKKSTSSSSSSDSAAKKAKKKAKKEKKRAKKEAKKEASKKRSATPEIGSPAAGMGPGITALAGEAKDSE
ncbi:unnamed protein product, partial [Durusdinium trenchii]